MKRFFSSMIVVFIFTQSSREQVFNPLLSDMLQDTFETYVGFIPDIIGMSAAVYVPGQGIWQDVARNSYEGVPITSDMLFGIASNTKLFVSASLLKLQEDGILDLDDEIGSWLPEYTYVDPTITIRQLLNHTSGVYDPIFVSPYMDTIMLNPTRVFTPEEVLSWLSPPYFAPGDGWMYSNVNYILAGMIIESASGSSVSEFIRDSILTPLDMDSTFYDVEEPETGTIAHRWYLGIDYNDTSRVGLNTAGGCAGAIFSTSGEMVQWYHALFDEGFLNEESIAELTEFISTGIPGYDYGLGFSKETTTGVTYWGHGGNTWGYRSKMIYDPCLHTVVCGLANSFPAGEEAVVFLMHSVLVNHLPSCGDIITGPDDVCQGETEITYTISPILHADTYEWILPSGFSGASTSNSIIVNIDALASSGNISVSGVNDYGKGPATMFAVTVHATPPAPVITQIGNTLHSDTPLGNQWYNSAGIMAGEINQDLLITVEDDYYDIVTLDGCSSENSEIIHALPSDVINENMTQGFIIYPNPVAQSLTIEMSESVVNCNYQITDMEGRIVLSGILSASGNIELNNLVNGVYQIQFYSKDFNEGSMFIKLND